MKPGTRRRIRHNINEGIPPGTQEPAAFLLLLKTVPCTRSFPSHIRYIKLTKVSLRKHRSYQQCSSPASSCPTSTTIPLPSHGQRSLLRGAHALARPWPRNGTQPHSRPDKPPKLPSPIRHHSLSLVPIRRLRLFSLTPHTPSWPACDSYSTRNNPV